MFSLVVLLKLKFLPNAVCIHEEAKPTRNLCSLHQQELREEQRAHSALSFALPQAQPVRSSTASQCLGANTSGTLR